MKSPIRASFPALGFLAASLLPAHEIPQPFEMTVLVDGAGVPEYVSRGRTYIEAFKGKEFSIRLTNPTSGRVAVALSVDGRNVVDALHTSERAASKWVLNPGQTVVIPGWQISGETARKFFFTETRSSYARWLGDTANVGTIEAAFFREKVRAPQPVLKDRAADAENRAETSRQAAGAPMPEAAAPKSAAKAPSPADDYAATGIGDRTSYPVQWVSFEEEAVPAARLSIRYEFRPQLVRLGVLPRADDGLASRDKARGFEHAYAPDPDAQR
ncbi:MAG TPA: hypothetical protein VMN82_06245 [Thermoanaerobaculia bacterium]|nr:hypothetical protein [Thermoanaerobaculia bacterium]